MRLHRIALSVPCVVVWAAFCAPATNAGPEGEEGAKPPTSWTFENVWYRDEKHGNVIKAFDASGTLTITPTALDFRAEKLELHIPMADVRNVSTGLMRANHFNQWAIAEYTQEGVTHLAGFNDGNRLGHGKDTVAIYDAIHGALLAAREAAKGMMPPEEAAPIVQEAGPVVQEAAPVVQEAGPVIEEAAPVVQEAGPVVEEASPQKMTWSQFNREVKQGFPVAPKTLVTDPARVGILLIDGNIRQALQSYDMDGIALVRKGDESHVYRAGAAGRRGLRDVVLFTGLEPDDYIVRIIRGSSGAGWLAVEMPPHPDFSIHIDAGKVHYLGKLMVKAKLRKVPNVERDHDPAREAEVLSLFADRYPGTAWATLALEQSRELHGAVGESPQ